MFKKYPYRLSSLVLILGLLIWFLGLNQTFVPEVAGQIEQGLSVGKNYTYLNQAVSNQSPGLEIINPLKHAIRRGVEAQVPVETITFLLLLPLVVSLISAARHLIGLRGFGIFLPAALATSFIEVGPLWGILLFIVIVTISTYVRLFLRKRKVKLQYLPRMAIILWSVVLGVLGILLLLPSVIKTGIAEISIFPLLILILLAEDFTRVQLGKSVRVAISLTSETLVLSLLVYLVIQFQQIQTFALLNPEIFLGFVLIFNIFLGKYSGLRLVELWRFRKLIKV